MAAAYPRVLGLCDRDLLHRGRRCDPDRRPGPPCRDPPHRHARVLRPAGKRAGAPGRSLEPLELDRERRESRRGWRLLGGGGLSGTAQAPEHFRLTVRLRRHATVRFFSSLLSLISFHSDLRRWKLRVISRLWVHEYS